MTKIALIILLSFVSVFLTQFVVGHDGEIKDSVRSRSSSTEDITGETISSLDDIDISPDQITNIGSEVKKAFQDIETSGSPINEVSPVADVAFTPKQEEEFYMGIGMAIKADLVHQAEVSKKLSMGEALSPGQEKEFMENFLKGFSQYLEKQGESPKEDNGDVKETLTSPLADENLSHDQVKIIGVEIKEAFQNTENIVSPDEKASSIIDEALVPKQEEEPLSTGQEKELEDNFLKGFT